MWNFQREMSHFAGYPLTLRIYPWNEVGPPLAWWWHDLRARRHTWLRATNYPNRWMVSKGKSMENPSINGWFRGTPLMEPPRENKWQPIMSHLWRSVGKIIFSSRSGWLERPKVSEDHKLSVSNRNLKEDPAKEILTCVFQNYIELWPQVANWMWGIHLYGIHFHRFEAQKQSTKGSWWVLPWNSLMAHGTCGSTKGLAPFVMVGLI